MIKIETDAFALGIRDGKDAYLLDRGLNNPYSPKDLYSYSQYIKGWHIGFNTDGI